VRADAARLPFGPAVFDAVIANHSFEHFADFEGALSEVARVLKPRGFLYVAVPDACTLCDRLYRWLARGGGHVNAFTDPDAVAAVFAERTGLAHAGTRLLHAGFSYLNRKNVPGGRLPRRALLLGAGYEPVLRVGTWLLHAVDRFCGTRLSVYGWAFYFGPIEIDVTPRVNVCIRCGAGHEAGRISGKWSYYCPSCGTRNYRIS
jgi:hypothetical protein